MQDSTVVPPVTPPPKHEKGALQSKKFIAFLVCQVGFFLLMGVMVMLGSVSSLGGNLAFIILAVTTGFVAVGYILGQAYVDKFVRVTSLALRHGGVNEPTD